jgi:hypothetical protein
VIDIKKDKVSRRESLRAAIRLGFLAGTGGLVMYHNRDALSRIVKPSGKISDKPCVMFVTGNTSLLSRSQGGALNSASVRDWAIANNIEYRRYREDADTFQLETWARAMHQIGLDFGAPCMVTVDQEGRGRAWKIPSGSIETIKLLSEVFGA